MILVLTVLGLLFVTGVAFMATMNFEASIIGANREDKKARNDVARVVDEAQDLVGDTLASPSAGALTASLTGQGASPAAYVELPGVHNLSAPIEPYPDPNTGLMIFPWSTDPRALLETNRAGQSGFTGSLMQGVTNNDPDTDPINTLVPPGSQPDPNGFPNKQNLMYLDADGDGISDSLGFEITPGSLPDLSRRQLREIARLVNAPTNPEGKVFLGLRVLSHGGMVNVNASSPLTVRNILFPQVGGGNELTKQYLKLGNYSTLIEEPPLRRRFMLLPAEVPPTRLIGNPFSKDAQLGQGDFNAVLVKNPIGPDKLETLRNPRYWTYGPNEYGADGSTPMWQYLMYADGANPSDPSADQYDRRHLITTVSHDDLLARPTIVRDFVRDNVNNAYTDKQINLVDYLLEEQRKDLQTKQSFGQPLTCDILDRFPILKYPFAPNAFKTPPPSTPAPQDELCECLIAQLRGQDECRINPRNGRLKLSLPWLQQYWSSGVIDLLPPQNGSRVSVAGLLQSNFTMLLYNARGGAWDFDPSTPENEYSFADISDTAAALTANFIDYFDGNDEPTEISTRRADYRTRGALQPRSEIGRVESDSFFGLERQPYITEVAAELVDGDDNYNIDGGTDEDGYLITVELFHPQGLSILEGYRLKIGDFSVDLPTSQFAVDAFRVVEIKKDSTADAFTWSPLPSSFETGLESGELSLTQSVFGGLQGGGYSIDVELIHRLSGAVVDKFNIVVPQTQVVYRAERLTNTGDLNRWYASLPVPTTVLQTDGNELKRTLGYGAPFSVGQYGGVNPVEAIQANIAEDDITKAFPTTGSLLALMRVANSTSEPFNALLDSSVGTGGYSIDNGRLPIYDVAAQHHLDPANWTNGQPGEPGTPGGLDYLPWGQLIFDYFTALPLSSSNPYADFAVNLDVAQLEAAKPQVQDMGMRVNGRINLNIAPWKVMEGLTFQPYDKFPTAVSGAVKTGLETVFGPTSNLLPGQTVPIGEKLAKAIVSYRELRELSVAAGQSLAYTGDPTSLRGWQTLSPTMRRGTGFMSIGELANVRYTNTGLPQDQEFRFDGGAVKQGQYGQSFLESTAPLMALSEWATLRSHVFTVYGVLRGELDPTLVKDNMTPDELRAAMRDADSRALRFQETVDRLPLLLGKEQTDRIGDRTIGRYVDVRGN
ncbi:MAG: hypothetical protein J5J06_19265 [Phycisphaerae bacterium]|nr:hypothetical protein [Phycisphaerae bacterium]